MSYDELEEFEDRYPEDDLDEVVEPENTGDNLPEIDVYDDDGGYYYDEYDEGDHLPELSPPDDNICTKCDGTGEFPEDHLCKACNGKGYIGE